MVRILMIFLALLVVPAGNARAEGDTDSFYDKIIKTVIRLEHFEYLSSEGNDKPVVVNNPDGTGFFVLYDDRLYLVSARHVVDTDHDLHARVKVFNEITKTSEIVLLQLPRKNWVFHPDNGDAVTHPVDVAVMKLPMPYIKDKFTGIFTTFLYDPADAKNNQLLAGDVLPPEQVIVFGFPGDTGFELFEQRPMGRLGLVSMYTGERFIKVSAKFANERCRILDIRAFPGNSGSPVITALGATKLLGVISASNSSDMGIMEPVSRVIETMEAARKLPIPSGEYWLVIKQGP